MLLCASTVRRAAFIDTNIVQIFGLTVAICGHNTSLEPPPPLHRQTSRFPIFRPKYSMCHNVGKV